MGAWGLGIEDNDSYCDVKYDFRDTYKRTKKDIERTIDCIELEYKGVNDFIDCQLYIALADESIRVKQPNKRIITKAIELIEKGIDSSTYNKPEERKLVTQAWVSKVKKHLEPTNV